MKINAGCGSDIRPGYLNVDVRRTSPIVYERDLFKTPWPWADGYAEEVMMLDFLEHVPHELTRNVLREARRVLSPGGLLVVQVPDFEVCARVILEDEFMCHRCGCTEHDDSCAWHCVKCGTAFWHIQREAMNRLYGGQDYPGNFHNNAFTEFMLLQELEFCGFCKFEVQELNQNGETYRQNWNMRVHAWRNG